MKISNVFGGLILGAGGIATLSAMDAVVKSLGASLPTFQIVFVRYVGAAIWLALFLTVTPNHWPKRQNLKRHMMRGALMALTACLFFYGVTHLPLAIAAALAMSAPIYIAFLGIVFLKEKASPTLFLAILLGVAGSLVIVFGGAPIPTSGSSSILMWGAAILAPLSYAATLVLLKHHASDEGAAAMTLAQSLAAAAITLPLAVSNFVPPTPHMWMQIALIGFFGACGFLLLIGGLRRLPASVFSLIDYTGLLWAAVFGFFFFSENVEPRLWIGGSMIIAACTIGLRTARKPAVATID